MKETTLSGAEYLAAIFGTEKDKVNCSFYFKIGACRHGDKCSRQHNRPSFSQTILLKNFLRNPHLACPLPDGPLRDDPAEEARRMQAHFDAVFEEIYCEIEDTYGEVDEINVCDNMGEHMIGNTYIKFHSANDAVRAVKHLNARWFAQMPIYAELSPVSDFREACCRQYEMGECSRGGYCNFMHLKPVGDELRQALLNRNRLKPPRIVREARRRRSPENLPTSYANETAAKRRRTESPKFSEEEKPMPDAIKALPRCYQKTALLNEEAFVETAPEKSSEVTVDSTPLSDVEPELPAAFRRRSEANEVASSPSSNSSDVVGTEFYIRPSTPPSPSQPYFKNTFVEL